MRRTRQAAVRLNLDRFCRGALPSRPWGLPDGEDATKKISPKAGVDFIVEMLDPGHTRLIGPGGDGLRRSGKPALLHLWNSCQIATDWAAAWTGAYDGPGRIHE